MNWLDSSSFSGLLSQAQKSIDKVLDIPSEDGTTSKKTRKNSETGISQSPKKQEKKSEQKSSSSWLSGTDSFWGSFTQNVSSSPKKDTKEKNEKSVEENESLSKTICDKGKVNNGPPKKSKLPTTKAINSKQNSKKNVSKKDTETSGSHLNKNFSAETQENGGVQSGNKKQNNIDMIDEKTNIGSKTKSDGTNFKSVNNDRVTVEKTENILMSENVTENKNFENGVQGITPVEKVEVVGNYSNNKIESDVFENIDLQSSEETREVDTPSENSKNFSVKKSDNAVNNAVDCENENALESKEEHEKQEEFVTEHFKKLHLSSAPVAASTPVQGQRQEPISCKTEDIRQMANLNHLLKEIELPEGQNDEQNIGMDLESETVKDSNTDGDVLKENKRLLEVIEVRESKLVELSKENLNFQETNTILQSQIEQLEELHKSEDAELEQMKEEFTKRIGESEAKLQAAAKERDLFKKQLEETQKCLSSDIERQLKEFQSLLQEKDEQIAQLMEEGEKLSKQILQCNTNIKKLRAKEKELNTVNEDKSTRLEEAETEIERLTGILKERDGHEKEQDDAITKLNAYTKKQDDLIAKQKIELEESASKLPSLQTALDNAYKEITELHKVNAAKSNEVQEATLSVEMTAKEELRIALEKLKKESQKECDVLAMELTDLQTQLNRNEQQAARREDNLRQEIADTQMRLQEAESRNQELTQSVSVATRPLLRQIENLQHSYGSQQTSWEKLEKNLTERLADAQSQLATAQEKERASTQRSIELSSKVASLESQVANYRQEKSRIEAEFELEKTKLEALEEFKSRESGKIEALKTMQSKQLETMMVEKSLLEQQLVVERTKYESEQKKLTKLEEQLRERPQKIEDIIEAGSEDASQQTSTDKRRSRNSSSSSILSLSDTMTRNLPSGGTAVLEELRATIRHKEGELVSMQSVVSTLESSRESLTEELTTLMNTNENLAKENKQLRHTGKSFQELQTKYNALLQMYGEKQEETEELKLDLQDIKSMYKAQIQELLSGR